MKKLGLFLAALTAVSFVSCDGALGAPKGAAPEQGAAAESRSYWGYYRFSGKNGQVPYWFNEERFTKEARKYLDPKYVGTDAVLETRIYETASHDDALKAFEAVGIPTYDHVRTHNPFYFCHFKFNMLNVTALEAR